MNSRKFNPSFDIFHKLHSTLCVSVCEKDQSPQLQAIRSRHDQNFREFANYYNSCYNRFRKLTK